MGKFIRIFFVKVTAVLACLLVCFVGTALSLGDNVNVKYASGFRVEKRGDQTLVRLMNPYPGSKAPVEYLLVHRGEEAERDRGGVKVIEVPVKNCISTTTVNIAFLRELGESHTLIGQGGKKYVYSPDQHEKNLPEVGTGINLNLERVMELKPDVLFAYAFSPKERENYKRLENMGINVVFMSEYIEDTPLGRAEWIKYLSLFFCKEKEASRIFERISENYAKVMENVAFSRNKPSVFSNVSMNGTWYVPAGGNWMSRLLNDAGAYYPWSLTEGKGSLALDFEAVFEKCYGCDFWINPGSWDSLHEALASDERYSRFKALKTGQIYNNTARVNPYGGNDYHQSGVMRPDLVLSDLVSIFHPEVLPEHHLVYYRKLEGDKSPEN